jgi:hypothetical protein
VDDATRNGYSRDLAPASAGVHLRKSFMVLS